MLSSNTGSGVHTDFMPPRKSYDSFLTGFFLHLCVRMDVVRHAAREEMSDEEAEGHVGQEGQPEVKKL